MKAKKIPPSHPGEILFEAFLQPMEISQNQLGRLPACSQGSSVRLGGKTYWLMKRWLFIWICLVPCLLLGPPAHASGIVNGTISLTMPDGQVRSGEWIRILLVRSQVAVPNLSEVEETNPYLKMETIRALHMTFFIAAREKMSDPAFVIQSSLTTPEGVFQFPGVSPGTYYLLVTFPAMIKDYKVAWQVPVIVVDEQTTRVELNDGNLLMPTYTRN